MTTEAATRKMATRQKVRLSLLFLIMLTFPITIHYGTCADTCPNKVIEYSWSRLLKI